MSCTPGIHSFDKMARALATGISRRDAFKYVGAGVLGTMLVSLGARQAEASRCTPNVCPGNSCKTDCFCQPTVKGRAFCNTSQFCSTVTSCTTNGQCKDLHGKGWKCVENCCANSPGCLPRCGLPGVTAAVGGATSGGR